MVARTRRQRRPATYIDAGCRQVQTADDAAAIIASHKPGDTVKISLVSSAGSTRTVEVAVGTRPKSL